MAAGQIEELARFDTGVILEECALHVVVGNLEQPLDAEVREANLLRTLTAQERLCGPATKPHRE